jgi:hypothetical protein
MIADIAGTKTQRKALKIARMLENMSIPDLTKRKNLIYR